MTNIIRSSALALALLGGVALGSAPALADNNHNHGHGHGHGNSWNNAHNDWYRNHRSHGFGYNGYGYRNPYAYYGPRPYYGYGNYYSRPGFSIYIR
jgi:hypothetical protein